MSSHDLEKGFCFVRFFFFVRICMLHNVVSDRCMKVTQDTLPMIIEIGPILSQGGGWRWLAIWQRKGGGR